MVNQPKQDLSLKKFNFCKYFGHSPRVNNQVLKLADQFRFPYSGGVSEYGFILMHDPSQGFTLSILKDQNQSVFEEIILPLKVLLNILGLGICIRRFGISGKGRYLNLLN